MPTTTSELDTFRHICGAGDLSKLKDCISSGVGKGISREKVVTESLQHECVKSGSVKCLEELARAYAIKVADLNRKDTSGCTCLQLAIIGNNQRMVEFLLARKVDVNITDKEKRSPLYWAVVTIQPDVVRKLIDAGADVCIKDVFDATLLHYAVQTCEDETDVPSSYRTLSLILEYLPSPDYEDCDGRTALVWAGSLGLLRAIEMLVGAKADPTIGDKDGLTVLHCAASEGHNEVIEFLVNKTKCPVDPVDRFGCTPLFYAAKHNRLSAISTLLSLGADADKQDVKGRTASHCAAAEGFTDILHELEVKGADLWIQSKKKEYPLHETIIHSHSDTAFHLFDRAANSVDLNERNKQGLTMLHMASRAGDESLVNYLIDRAVDVNAVYTDKSGAMITALDVCDEKGYQACSKLLKKHGAACSRPVSSKASKPSSAKSPRSASSAKTSNNGRPNTASKKSSNNGHQNTSSAKSPNNGHHSMASPGKASNSGRQNASTAKPSKNNHPNAASVKPPSTGHQNTKTPARPHSDHNQEPHQRNNIVDERYDQQAEHRNQQSHHHSQSPDRNQRPQHHSQSPDRNQRPQHHSQSPDRHRDQHSHHHSQSPDRHHDQHPHHHSQTREDAQSRQNHPIQQQNPYKKEVRIAEQNNSHKYENLQPSQSRNTEHDQRFPSHRAQSEISNHTRPNTARSNPYEETRLPYNQTSSTSFVNVNSHIRRPKTAVNRKQRPKTSIRDKIRESVQSYDTIRRSARVVQENYLKAPRPDTAHPLSDKNKSRSTSSSSLSEPAPSPNSTPTDGPSVNSQASPYNAPTYTVIATRGGFTKVRNAPANSANQKELLKSLHQSKGNGILYVMDISSKDTAGFTQGFDGRLRPRTGLVLKSEAREKHRDHY